jgi:hypothetical protein
MEKYRRVYRRCLYGACALHFWYLRLQTHSEYCFSTVPMVTQWRLNVTYTYINCLARFNVQSHAKALKYSYTLTVVRPFLTILFRNLRSLRRFCVINKLYIHLHTLAHRNIDSCDLLLFQRPDVLS